MLLLDMAVLLLLPKEAMTCVLYYLLLLSYFSRVRLCETS